jgi:hypothetical protein
MAASTVTVKINKAWNNHSAKRDSPSGFATLNLSDYPIFNA